MNSIKYFVPQKWSDRDHKWYFYPNARGARNKVIAFISNVREPGERWQIGEWMENRIMTILKNWSVQGSADPYLAPEAQTKHLVGEVYDHPDPRHYDGKNIQTSAVVEVDGMSIKTYSGTNYFLEDPHPDYLEYLKTIGYDFDPDNPIKLN